MDSLRIDKWLWAARFYKTRSLACDEVTKHRVQINGQDVKPAREVKVGDTLTVRQGNITKTVQVKGISAARGPAPVAQPNATVAKLNTHGTSAGAQVPRPKHLPTKHKGTHTWALNGKPKAKT
jgi:ribosome-associated heat shock protein Hsp15